MSNSITTVPLYDTLGPQAMKFIINETEMATIMISPNHIMKLCTLKLDDEASKSSALRNLTNLIVFDDSGFKEFSPK
jgi:long-subunit acyl-CoA synthetase (AMP-forming)